MIKAIRKALIGWAINHDKQKLAENQIECWNCRKLVFGVRGNKCTYATKDTNRNCSGCRHNC